MYLEFRIGTPGKAGYTQPQALGDASVAVSDTNPRYATLASRGLVYTLSGTALAGSVVGAAAAPLVGIYNPPTSTVQAVLLSIGYGSNASAASSIPPGGVVAFLANPTGITAASANAPVNNLTFKAAGSQMFGFVASAITGGGTPTILRPISGAFSSGVATTSGPEQGLVREDTAGEIIVIPGNFLGIYTNVAGTTPLLVAHLTWAEIAVASL